MSETSEQFKDKGNKYYVQKQYKEAIEGIIITTTTTTTTSNYHLPITIINTIITSIYRSNKSFTRCSNILYKSCSSIFNVITI